MKELLERVFMLPVRLKARWRDRHRLRAWEGALTSFRNVYEKSGELGLDNHRLIYNIGLYVLLLEHDLTCLRDDMVYANNEWRRKFVARQMAVLLYEGVDDLPTLLGGNFRKALKAIGCGRPYMEELNSITGQLADFRRNNAVELQKLRNLVGAHRDHDAGAQLRLLEDLKPLAVFELMAQFYVPFRELVDWLTRLTLATGRLEVMLRQYLKKGQQ